MAQIFLAQLYFAHFLCLLALDQYETAQQDLNLSIELLPLLSWSKECLQLITDWSLKQTGGAPEVMVLVTFRHLQKNNPWLNRHRWHILSQIHTSQAIDAYAAGYTYKTYHHILNGIYAEPSLIKNRGIRAMLIKTALNEPVNVFRKIHKKTKQGDMLPPPILKEVETVLHTVIESATPITIGLSGEEIYSIKTGNQIYILRLLTTNHLQQRLAIHRLVSSAGLPVPVILGSGNLLAKTKNSWLLEEWKMGEPFEPHRVLFEDQTKIVGELGRYLRQLHQIKVNGFGLITSPQLDATNNTFSEWLNSQQNKIVRGCALGVIPEPAFKSLYMASNFLLETYTEPPVLSHGDLSDDNLLVFDSHITGIIDWGSVEGNDPAYDVAVFLVSLSHWWTSTQNNEILNSILHAYAPDNPAHFRQRIIAHRLLYAAREVVRLKNFKQDEHFEACQSILLNTNPESFDSPTSNHIQEL